MLCRADKAREYQSQPYPACGVVAAYPHRRAFEVRKARRCLPPGAPSLPSPHRSRRTSWPGIAIGCGVSAVAGNRRRLRGHHMAENDLPPTVIRRS